LLLSISQVRGAYPVIGHLIYVLNNYERILDSTLKEFKETRRKTLQIFLPFCPAFILTIDPRNVEHILSKKFTNYEKVRLGLILILAS
jgi:hypothetical protein